MSYPRQAPSLRRITVRNTEFRWRFSPGESNGILAVYGPASGRQPLIVTLAGWRDPWLAFPAPITNEPAVIGPGFVSQAIAHALANAWQPHQAGPPLRLDYQDGAFSSSQSDGPQV